MQHTMKTGRGVEWTDKGVQPYRVTGHKGKGKRFYVPPIPGDWATLALIARNWIEYGKLPEGRR